MNDFTSFCVAGFFLIWAPTAMAQEDQRFFGRWLPASTSAGGWPLIVEPGRFYSLNHKDEIVDEEHYQLIRDFGDRLVIKSWPVKPIIEGARTDPDLMILVVRDNPPFQSLEIDYCGAMHVNAFFFSDDNPEEIWARIMAWSKQEGQFPEILSRFPNRCMIEQADETVTLSTSSGMGFYRELEKN